MKRMICLILACLLLSGCSYTVQELSHHRNESTETQTQPSETTAPTLPANPYGPLDFGFEGDYLACLAGEYMPGIDVSYWQGQIDWQQVKAAGIQYAMLRVGYRSTDAGLIGEDPMVRQYYQEASAAGLKIGCYFFSQAVTVAEAVEEAQFVLQTIDGWNVEMPVVFDWEYIDQTARTAGMDARTLTDCAKAFCSTIQAAGYTPMIYYNRNLALDSIYLEELTDYKFWLAMYETSMTYSYKIDMWQYSCTGTVPGISTDVDLNLYFIYE